MLQMVGILNMKAIANHSHLQVVPGVAPPDTNERGKLMTRTILAVAAAAGLGVLGAPLTGAAQAPSNEELWKALEKQREEIERLEQQLKTMADRVEQAGREGWWTRTSVGGYGELHYNGGNRDEIDFGRAVIFVGHQFTDSIRFYTEWDLEHAVAGEGENGELELEQAYLQFDFTKNFLATTGLFLIPVGILNETHEPPTFYGVERNQVETSIIPTTWWEAGGGLTATFEGGWRADFAFTSGLEVPTTGPNAFKIRNGRQKVSEATAKDFAYTGRIRWTGLPGVEVGVTGQFQNDLTQGAPGAETEATLFEAHTDIQKYGFGLRALYARWDLDSAAAEAVGRDMQYGWYVEPSYRYTFQSIGDVGVFYRHSEWNNEAGDAVLVDRKFKQDQVGLNYWPHPLVVLKFDYQFDDAPSGELDDNRVNLGIGFQF